MPDDTHAATPPDGPGHATRKDLRMKATEAMPNPPTGMLPGEFLTPTPDAEPLRLGPILGQGGMAIVYEGHDPVLDRPVAVKVMRPELSADAELRARFFFEARILGQMDHPGIVPVFTAGTLGEHGCFYTMKKVQGRTLRDILRGLSRRDRRDRQQGERLIEIFENICQTMAYAHAERILHRDLKPENIMADDFGVVLVLDWGLSKRLGVQPDTEGILATQVGVVKGTPAYMSPEQARGSTGEVDYRSDVFALGIILYEILTGELPFAGQSRLEVVQGVLHKDPLPPRQANRRANPALAAICMKALSKDPARRYPSAKELCEDIRLYRDRLPTSAYKPSLLETAGNWVGRNSALAAAIGTALVLVLAFAGFALHRQEAARIRRAEQADRNRILASLEEQREKEKTQKTLLAIRTSLATLRQFDEKILDLEARAAKTPAADAAALQALRRQIDELDTARYMLTNNLRSTAVHLVAQLTSKTGGDISQLDPDILKFFRDVAVESVQAMAKRRDYYKAHYYLWEYLRPDRDSPVTWTDAQLKKLTELNRQVDDKLRELRGPGVPLPDWAPYRETMIPRKRN